MPRRRAAVMSLDVDMAGPGAGVGAGPAEVASVAYSGGDSGDASAAAAAAYAAAVAAAAAAAAASAGVLGPSTVYDAVPESAKVVVFDIAVPPRIAFAAFVEHDLKAAPVWDGGTGGATQRRLCLHPHPRACLRAPPRRR